MATWPSGNKASTTNLDAGTDKPSLARADIKQNVDNVNDIIDMFNISAPTNNQILKYNSTNTRFELSSDVDTNTTYSISAETATGGANLRLTGSDTTTDDVKLAAGTGISVSQTDANTITITNTQSDSDTLYSISAETATGGVNLRLTGTNLVTDDVKLAEGSNITLTRTDANTITIAATDTTGMTSFSVAGDTGTSQTIENSNTLTISGGTGLSSVASATDTITINLDNTAVTSGSYTYASITVDAQGRLTSASSGTAPVTSVTGGTGISVSGTTTPTVSLANTAVTPGSYTYTSITVDAQGRITSASNGTAPSTISVSDDTTTNATRYIVFEDVTSGTSSSINVASTKLTFNPSTGRITATELTGSLRAYNEGTIYDLGTTGGTIAPNVSNGNVQKITLNAALTINAFTSPVAGQSLTLIIYGGTAYTSITSTMKFLGGVKTLTGTAGCIDILTVYYDGTTYFAALGKGYA